jgi:transposase
MPDDGGGRSDQVGPGAPRGSSPEKGLISPRSRQEEPRCPRCGGTGFYCLADGRLKCRTCRARFTPDKHPGHLDPQLRAELTSLFWRMVPATRAAVRVGLNRKTVQRHYYLLRQGLAAISDDNRHTTGADWRVAGYFYGRLLGEEDDQGISGDVPLFGLARREALVMVIIMPGERDYRGLKTDSVHYVGTSGRTADGRDEGLDLAEAFWSFSRPRLGHYQGGWKANLPLFLHEMAFRFNWREKTIPPEPLLALV